MAPPDHMEWFVYDLLMGHKCRSGFGGYLGVVWNVSGGHLEGFLNMFEGCWMSLGRQNIHLNPTFLTTIFFWQPDMFLKNFWVTQIFFGLSVFEPQNFMGLLAKNCFDVLYFFTNISLLKITTEFDLGIKLSVFTSILNYLDFQEKGNGFDIISCLYLA